MDFSDLFQQEEFSDVLLILKAPSRKRGRDDEASAAGPDTAGAASVAHHPSTLNHPVSLSSAQSSMKFPFSHLGLSFLAAASLNHAPLDLSVLYTQMQRWQQEEEGEQQQQPQQEQQQHAAVGPASKRRLVATVVLDSAQQEPVAMALLAAMYQGPKALAAADLTDVLLLEIVLLADMLGTLQVAQQAVEEIRTRAVNGHMSAQLQEALLQLQAWPACLKNVFIVLAVNSYSCDDLSMPDLARAWLIVDGLQPDSTLDASKAAVYASTLESALLARLKHLQKAWGLQRLREQILGLPLAAMQLLLDSDKLEVASEDDVYFTAHRYIAHQRTPELQRLARERLAPLIRVPGLSQRWIMEQLTAGAPEHLVLRSVLQPMRLWLSMQEVDRCAKMPIAGAPDSWGRGSRASVGHVAPVSHVTCACQVSVADIKRGSCRAFDERPRSAVLTLAYSAPLAGAGFHIYLLFRASDAGTTLSVLCQQVTSSSKAETLVFLDIAFVISLGPVSRSGTAVSATQGPIVHNGSVGWAGFRDFLQIGPMAGGWDKVAWANKGLPAAGKVGVRLKVSLAQDNQQGAPQDPADVE